MLDIFTSSQLINVIYYFLCGFPKELLEKEEMVESLSKSSSFDDLELTSVKSSLSPSKKKGASLLDDLGLKLSRINFESKNLQSSYNIHNPFM